jgi:integral membrane sensor domain MASE1
MVPFVVGMVNWVSDVNAIGVAMPVNMLVSYAFMGKTTYDNTKITQSATMIFLHFIVVTSCF